MIVYLINVLKLVNSRFVLIVNYDKFLYNDKNMYAKKSNFERLKCYFLKKLGCVSNYCNLSFKKIN